MCGLVVERQEIQRATPGREPFGGWLHLFGEGNGKIHRLWCGPPTGDHHGARVFGFVAPAA